MSNFECKSRGDSHLWLYLMVLFIFCKSCDIPTIYERVQRIEERLPTVVYVTNTVYLPKPEVAVLAATPQQKWTITNYPDGTIWITNKENK